VAISIKRENDHTLPGASLSCFCKKVTKEQPWGGFELIAPAIKATSPRPRQARIAGCAGIAFFADRGYKARVYCLLLYKMETAGFLSLRYILNHKRAPGLGCSFALVVIARALAPVAISIKRENDHTLPGICFFHKSTGMSGKNNYALCTVH